MFAIEPETGPAQVPQAGPLLFAGEQLSKVFTGFMNGVLQTGRRAADAISPPAEIRRAA